MRTSRASKETAKVLQALSPPARRTTRSSAQAASRLQGFAFGGATAPDVSVSDDDTSSLSSVPTVDIEDIMEPPAKRRKSALSATSTRANARSSRRIVKTETSVKEEISVKEETIVKTETAVEEAPVKKEPAEKPSKARRTPARKIKTESGAYAMQPPSNWETMYDMVKKMREANPTAPVDTMGCAELYWRASSPRDRRFQTLVALMLSSQTKDTVTAVAMQRLHTELGDQSTSIVKKEPEEYDWKPTDQVKDSTLNLENILAVTPERLNELIAKVGFHNNKTKYIKAAANILRDQYDSDIPSTAPELMKLPGVGPKMAFLCMSAAWGKHEGIGVDVHVHRITNLWGWHKTKNPEETRMALESWLPKDKWHEINKLLVGLGQTVCLPVARRCGECDLAGTKLLTPKRDAVKQEGPKVKVEQEMEVSKKGPTLFDLPENIRNRIFDFAALRRSCIIDFTLERDRIKRDPPYCHRTEFRAHRSPWLPLSRCYHPKLPTQVFLSCHTLRREAGAYFFSHNRFSMFLRGRADYKNFEASLQWGMEHIRYLHVDLGHKDNRTLKLAGGSHQTLLTWWAAFCKLAAIDMPNLRYFSLKCKAYEQEVVVRVMRDMDPFPSLFKCAFYFSNDQDKIYSFLPAMKRTARRLTDNLDVPPFPFMYLPRELQLMVLGHLLICRSDPCMADPVPGLIVLDYRDRLRFKSCCGTCSPVGGICFCDKTETVFSTGCTCFASPLRYFLVSREFHELARQVFWGRNKFMFVEEDPTYTMGFLSGIPTESTILVQNLTFHFPLCFRATPQTGARSADANLRHWAVLRRFIREHFDLARLTLKIHDQGRATSMYTMDNRKRYLRRLLMAFTDMRGLRGYRVYLRDDRGFERQAVMAVMGRWAP
ncbi:endonuclease III domain-containing protein [Aspergillus vadensis CBS 113365]|uniref:Endonuclease III homolog n=1 Tax=Aspergillus vadensis (strain CBS 113365 / IMI 142717 / IBT 24658) TaxID=1448311 RepID=A0A319BF36_ASPVC|nr:hypothetical protein BO88DRAFT_447004 [Aspergillus vadensis CBS 113365]PYH64533.1 hypothetical protein BO88DRAFT_447004 [Aspergillus vadensis CBS 113365]